MGNSLSGEAEARKVGPDTSASVCRQADSSLAVATAFMIPVPITTAILAIPATLVIAAASAAVCGALRIVPPAVIAMVVKRVIVAAAPAPPTATIAVVRAALIIVDRAVAAALQAVRADIIIGGDAIWLVVIYGAVTTMLQAVWANVVRRGRRNIRSGLRSSYAGSTRPRNRCNDK